MVYPTLLPLMHTPRLPAVDWTDAPADLNGLVRFSERRNLVSARVPSHFNWPLPENIKSRTLIKTFIPVRISCTIYWREKNETRSWDKFSKGREWSCSRKTWITSGFIILWFTARLLFILPLLVWYILHLLCLLSYCTTNYKIILMLTFRIMTIH